MRSYVTHAKHTNSDSESSKWNFNLLSEINTETQATFDVRIWIMDFDPYRVSMGPDHDSK